MIVIFCVTNLFLLTFGFCKSVNLNIRINKYLIKLEFKLHRINVGEDGYQYNLSKLLYCIS